MNLNPNSFHSGGGGGEVNTGKSRRAYWKPIPKNGKSGGPLLEFFLLNFSFSIVSKTSYIILICGR